MAVPKKKTSKSKRNLRRSHHRLTFPSLTTCSNCNEKKLPYHICPSCGYYRNKLILEKNEEAKAS